MMDSVKVLVEGSKRARIKVYEEIDESYISVKVEEIDDLISEDDSESKGLQSGLIKIFEKFVKLDKKNTS